MAGAADGQTCRSMRRNFPWPIRTCVVAALMGVGRRGALRASVRPAPVTAPCGYRKRRSWLEIQSQPRMMSRPEPRESGGMSMSSRRGGSATRAKWTATGGGSRRVVSGDAMLTAAGPGPAPGGSSRRTARSAQIKQCVAPVSSNTVTRRGPNGVHTAPCRTGLKAGSCRRHGVYASGCTRRARARASTASWTASAAIVVRRSARATCADAPGAGGVKRPRGRWGTSALLNHRCHPGPAPPAAPASETPPPTG